MSTDPPGSTPTSAEAAGLEPGGDPPCWLDQVCAACGRLIEDRLADACPSCGAARDADGS